MSPIVYLKIVILIMKIENIIEIFLKRTSIFLILIFSYKENQISLLPTIIKKYLNDQGS